MYQYVYVYISFSSQNFSITDSNFQKYISYFLFTVGPAESLRPGILLIEVLGGSWLIEVPSKTVGMAFSALRLTPAIVNKNI